MVEQSNSGPNKDIILTDNKSKYYKIYLIYCLFSIIPVIYTIQLIGLFSFSPNNYELVTFLPPECCHGGVEIIFPLFVIIIYLALTFSALFINKTKYKIPHPPLTVYIIFIIVLVITMMGLKYQQKIEGIKSSTESALEKAATSQEINSPFVHKQKESTVYDDGEITFSLLGNFVATDCFSGASSTYKEIAFYNDSFDDSSDPIFICFMWSKPSIFFDTEASKRSTQKINNVVIKSYRPSNFEVSLTPNSFDENSSYISVRTDSEDYYLPKSSIKILNELKSSFKIL